MQFMQIHSKQIDISIPSLKSESDTSKGSAESESESKIFTRILNFVHSSRFPNISGTFYAKRNSVKRKRKKKRLPSLISYSSKQKNKKTNVNCVRVSVYIWVRGLMVTEVGFGFRANGVRIPACTRSRMTASGCLSLVSFPDWQCAIGSISNLYNT